jgi:hypothetical protein
MSVLDEIRKLDEQKAKLLETAKKEALDQANQAIATLRELGFNYRLAEMDRPVPIPRGATTARASGGTRRSGVREQVLDAVKAVPGGVSRAKLLETMDAKGDKSAEQSISNALAALKKAGAITAHDGLYKAA